MEVKASQEKPPMWEMDVFVPRVRGPEWAGFRGSWDSREPWAYSWNNVFNSQLDRKLCAHSLVIKLFFLILRLTAAETPGPDL